MKRLTIIALLAVILFSRIPLLEKTPYEWDSVNLLLGVEGFDISQDRPHPPGYIGYTALGKSLNLLFHNPHLSLLILNIIFTLLLLWGIWLLGCSLVNRRAGILAVLIAAASPLTWFYGLIINTYLAGAALWILLAHLFLRLKRDSSLNAALAGFIWGLSGSIRPDVMVMIAPMAFYSLWKYRRWNRLPLLFPAFLSGVAVWVVPTIALSGAPFFTYLKSLLAASGGKTSVFLGASVRSHAMMLAKAFLWLLLAWGWALPLIPFRRKGKPVGEPGDGLNAEAFLLSGVLPPLVLMLAFHLPKAGYLLLYYPGLILLGVFWLDRLSRRFERRRLLLGRVYPAVIIAVWVCYFLFWPGGGIPAEQNAGASAMIKAGALSWSRIRAVDRYTLDWTVAIGDEYNPERTLIITAGKSYDWRRVTYQLREFRVFQVLPVERGVARGQIGFEGGIIPVEDKYTLPAAIKKIIILTETSGWIDREIIPQTKLTVRDTEAGVRWFEADAGGEFMVGGVRFTRLSQK